MTIKKLKTVKATPVPQAAGAGDEGVADMTPVAGGATIADRFKLDAPDPKAKAGTVSKKAASAALIAGLLALVAAGVLTFVLYQHWEFLMSA